MIVAHVNQARHIVVRRDIMAVRQMVHRVAHVARHIMGFMGQVLRAVHRVHHVVYRRVQHIHFRIRPAVAPPRYLQNVVAAKKRVEIVE